MSSGWKNKFDRSEAARRDLMEQMQTKIEGWKEQESEYKNGEYHARKLCEEILGHDSGEIVLGRQYSWDSMSIADIAQAALKSYRKYNADKTDLLKKLLELAEDRRLKMESLEEQLEYYQNNSAGRKQPEAKIQEAAPVREEQKPDKSRIEMIIEEDSDLVSEEESISAAVEALTFTQEEIPVHPARKRMKKRQAEKETRHKAHMIDLGEYREKITPLMWTILEVIGKEGISVYTEIAHRIEELQPDKITAAKIRMSVRELYSMNVLHQEQISDPLRSKFMAYRLTEIGQRLYKDHFSEPANLSELDRICSQHDNANHGFGIRSLAELLMKNYDSVCYDASQNRISLKRGNLYIPDITARSRNGEVHYYEYECGTHTQHDFNAKCNKVLEVTDTIRIVVPNQEVLKRLTMQTRQYLKNKPNRKYLRGKMMQITTMGAIKNADPAGEECWIIRFDIAEDEPELNG